MVVVSLFVPLLRNNHIFVGFADACLLNGVFAFSAPREGNRRLVQILRFYTDLYPHVDHGNGSGILSHTAPLVGPDFCALVRFGSDGGPAHGPRSKVLSAGYAVGGRSAA
jgi:hypothetical protein